MSAESFELLSGGSIAPIYAKKTAIKVLFSSGIILAGIAGMTHMMMFFISMDLEEPLPISAYLILWGITVGIAVFCALIGYWYTTAYIRNFTYQITPKFILIHQGVFTKDKTTIPFSRVQNITVSQGIFDRMFKLYTVKVETAGMAGFNPQGGTVKPEGYIPGIQDPKPLENIINRLVHEYTQAPMENLKGKVIHNPDLAFDEFAAYILEKISQGGEAHMKNRIAELRAKKNLSQIQLAEKVGVTRQTIYYLENGKYMPSLKIAMLIAGELGVKVEELFELEPEDKKAE